jgi:hypothetical protein
MEVLIPVVKYGLLVVLAVEAVLVGRALVDLAVSKARPTQAAPSPEE